MKNKSLFLTYLLIEVILTVEEDVLILYTNSIAIKLSWGPGYNPLPKMRADCITIML